MDEIFKAYDVRGVYGKNLTSKEAFLFGYYLAKKLGLNSFKVAHDLRESHEDLTKFFLRGLIHAQANPIYLGPLSTVNFYYSLFEGVNSGCVITASHNSKEYNGFKVMYELKSFDSRDGLSEVGIDLKEDIDNIEEVYFTLKSEIEGKSLEKFIEDEFIEVQKNSQESYIGFLEDFSKSLFEEREIRVLQEKNFGFCFSSGMTSLALKPLINNLDFGSKFYLDVPDPNFLEYNPEPREAKEYILENVENVECTFVYDGDGDRVFIYDENQKLVLEDYFILEFVKYFLGQKKEGFVFDLRISREIEEVLEMKGVKFNVLRVGRAFYQDFLSQREFCFGAELSGHLFFEDFNYLDNPDIATLIFLKVVANYFLENSSFKVSDLFCEHKYFKVEETNVEVNDSQEIISYLKSKYENNLKSEIDGVSFDFGDYWFNLRASNTEPIVRINLEAISEEIARKKIKELIELFN